MAADFNKPALTSTKTSFLTELQDNYLYISTMADGAPSASNIPTNTKRMDNATGEVFNYNGASWDSIGFISLTRDPVGDIVDGAPAALDTLNELAAALADDANFSATVTASLGEKMVKAQNLNDLANKATARTNLDVYSKSEVDVLSGASWEHRYVTFGGGNSEGLTSGSPMSWGDLNIHLEEDKWPNLVLHMEQVGAGIIGSFRGECHNRNIVFLMDPSSGTDAMLPGFEFHNCNVSFAIADGASTEIYFSNHNADQTGLSNDPWHKFYNCKVTTKRLDSTEKDYSSPAKMHFRNSFELHNSTVDFSGIPVDYSNGFDGSSAHKQYISLYNGSSFICGALSRLDNYLEINAENNSLVSIDSIADTDVTSANNDINVLRNSSFYCVGDIDARGLVNIQENSLFSCNEFSAIETSSNLTLSMREGSTLKCTDLIVKGLAAYYHCIIYCSGTADISSSPGSNNQINNQSSMRASSFLDQTTQANTNSYIY